MTPRFIDRRTSTHVVDSITNFVNDTPTDLNKNTNTVAEPIEIVVVCACFRTITIAFPIISRFALPRFPLRDDDSDAKIIPISRLPHPIYTKLTLLS